MACTFNTLEPCDERTPFVASVHNAPFPRDVAQPLRTATAILYVALAGELAAMGLV
jgi:hypothetical protein